MVYTVGAIFAAAALYLAMRWYKGQPIPFMNIFNPEASIHQVRFDPIDQFFLLSMLFT
jgi:hypothetical protein